MTYIWRFKPIRFNGLPVPQTRPREDDLKDGYSFDHEFKDREEFAEWHKERTIGLAELDQAMNFCKYFVRTKGNEGFYVRDGKQFPVRGDWVGIQDFDSNYLPTQPFINWMWRNGITDATWFELMDKYK